MVGREWSFPPAFIEEVKRRGSDVTAEYGNFSRTSVEGGIGGPITETLGIRVAGQWDKLGGFVRDIVTDAMFPQSEETGARLTLQWAPADNFEATLKAEYGHRDREGDGNVMCRTRHPVAQNERSVVVPGQTSFDEIITVGPIPDDCDEGFRRVGIREGGDITFKPVPDIYQEDARTGFVDLSEVVKLANRRRIPVGGGHRLGPLRIEEL